MQVSVLVSVLTRTTASIMTDLRYDFKGYIEIYRYFVMIVASFFFSTSSDGDHTLGRVDRTMLCEHKHVFM
jgi:hypothetical protein